MVMRGAAAGAATVWTASAVTMMTSTPAFAASSVTLTLTSSANYLNHTNSSTVDPTRLVMGNITINNSGTQPANGVAIQLRIPQANYAVAPQVIQAATVNTGGITGGTVGSNMVASGSDWLLTLTLGTALGVGETRTISNLRFGFRDGAGNVVGTLTGFSWSDAPFRRWGGNAFTMNNTATATNNGTTPATSAAAVVATPLSTFTESQNITISHDGSANNNPRITATIPDFWNNGRSSIGQITLVLRVDKNTNSRNVWYNVPVATPSAIDSKWTFTGFDSNGGAGPWRWTFQTIITGYAPASGTNGGPSGDFDGPTSSNSFSCTVQATYVSGNNAAGSQGTRDMTLSAPHATSITWDNGD